MSAVEPHYVTPAEPQPTEHPYDDETAVCSHEGCTRTNAAFGLHWDDDDILYCWKHCPVCDAWEAEYGTRPASNEDDA